MSIDWFAPDKVHTLPKIPSGSGIVPYVEVIGNAAPGTSPTETFSSEGGRVVKIYQVPWDARTLAVYDILGVNLRGNNNEILRRSPLWLPEYDRDQKLFAREIQKIEGIGKPADDQWRRLAGTKIGASFTNDAGQVIVNAVPDQDCVRYRIAQLTIAFELLPYNCEKGNVSADESKLDRWVTKEIKGSGQYLTLPTGTAMKFVGGPDDQKTFPSVNARPGKIVPNYDVRITWYRVPQTCIPSMFYNPSLTVTGAADYLLGRVNNATFPAGDPKLFGGSFLKGTLLYLGMAAKQYRTHAGYLEFDIEYLFQYAHNSETTTPNGHNFVPYLSSANTFGWVQLTTDGANNVGSMTAGKSIYDYGDFTGLFRPPN